MASCSIQAQIGHIEVEGGHNQVIRAYMSHQGHVRAYKIIANLAEVTFASVRSQLRL